MADTEATPARVRWTKSVEEIPNESTSAHVPSAYDGRLHVRRPRAATPRTPSIHSSDTETVTEQGSEETPRGRSHVRTRIILPARHRIVSLAAYCRRRSRPRDIDLSKSGTRSFLTTDELAELTPESERVELFEPPPIERVLGTVSERLTPEDSSGTVSPPTSSHSPNNEARSRARSIMVNLDPFDSNPKYYEISVSEAFKAHRDTFALLDLPRKQQHASPPSSLFGASNLMRISSTIVGCMQFISRFLDHESFLAIRLTCRALSYEATEATPLKLPAVYSLPQELIQEIFSSLSPFDFDAARRTCHSWMVASMDKSLLQSMLERGGWQRSAQEHLTSAGDDIWQMSGHLARECALSTFWTGYGAPEANLEDDPGLSDARLDGPTDSPEVGEPFELVLETDFSGLCEGGAEMFRTDECDDQNGDGLHFTASVCGRFILIFNGCRIYVYRLGKGSVDAETSLAPSRDQSSANLSYLGGRSRAVSITSSSCSRCRDGRAQIFPVTSIICPRKVKSVSMDTSSGRYAIAALLNDRIGLVCDLLANGASRSQSIPEASPSSTLPSDSYPCIETRWSNRLDVGSLAMTTPPPTRYAPANIFFDTDAPAKSSIRLPGHSHSTLLTRTTRPIPFETGPRSIYWSLGSDDDPPISVAICPQRRCVAFGCGSGIELHWVDALTGQDFNRWFPQPAASDFLYFLPSKAGEDNAKKLKLVSSAGIGTSSSALRSSGKNRHGPFKSYSAINLGPNSIWSTQSFFNERTHPPNHVSPYPADNYRAVPLSDGFHMVFIDPDSGLTCLGTDTPIGGPTKLFRRVLLQGPASGTIPEVYAVGSDLRQGVRIVVGFGDEVWLFSVPRAIFTCEGPGIDEPWAPYYTDMEKTEKAKSVWPLCIKGRYVARAPGLAELAVDTRAAPGFVIWAFGMDGMARAWQAKGMESKEVDREYVAKCGALHAQV